MCPIIDGVLHGAEDDCCVHGLSCSLKEFGEGLEHGKGEALFLGFGLFPGSLLTKNFIKVGKSCCTSFAISDG